MTVQFWIVGLSNTIHLLATIVWIGWSALLPLVIAPHVRQAHGDGEGWVTFLARRAPPLAYGALATLGATGMIQMSAHPQYEGMFAISNLWSALLLAKHLFIVGSVVIILYLGQSVSPDLRLALRREALGKSNQATALAGRFRLLAWLNFASGAGVLLLTGLMTAIR